MNSYSDKLKDPRWQKMRLKVMEYADFRCQICGDGKSPLHVHHSYYTRGHEPWQYPMGSLICICEYHHGKIHEIQSAPKPKDQTAIFWDEFLSRIRKERNLIVGLLGKAYPRDTGEGNELMISFPASSKWDMDMLQCHTNFLTEIATDMSKFAVIVKLELESEG